jgi:hypothetical protein
VFNLAFIATPTTDKTASPLSTTHYIIIVSRLLIDKKNATGGVGRERGAEKGKSKYIKQICTFLV